MSRCRGEINFGLSEVRSDTYMIRLGKALGDEFIWVAISLPNYTTSTFTRTELALVPQSEVSNVKKRSIISLHRTLEGGSCPLVCLHWRGPGNLAAGGFPPC